MGGMAKRSNVLIIGTDEGEESKRRKFPPN